MTPTTLGATVVCSSADPEWLDKRWKLGITASDVPAMLGESPYCSPLQLWARKVRPLDEQYRREATERMRWGHRHEASIIDALNTEPLHRRRVRPAQQLLAHPTLPLLATLDATEIVRHPDGPGNAAIVWELKTTDSRNYREWWQEDIPSHVQRQVEAQHLVCSEALPDVGVACLIGGNSLSVNWHRSTLAAESRIATELGRWWPAILHARESGDYAAPDWMPLDYDGARELAGQVAEGEMIEVDSEEMLQLDKRRGEVVQMQGTLAQERRAIDARLLQIIGSRPGIRLTSGVTYSYRTQTTTQHVVRERTTRVLRRHAPKKGS